MSTPSSANAATPDPSLCWLIMGRSYSTWFLIHNAPRSFALRNMMRPDHLWTKSSFRYPFPGPSGKETKEFLHAKRNTIENSASAMKPVYGKRFINAKSTNMRSIGRIPARFKLLTSGASTTMHTMTVAMQPAMIITTRITRSSFRNRQLEGDATRTLACVEPSTKTSYQPR